MLTSIQDHSTPSFAHTNDYIIQENDDEEVWEFPDEDDENSLTTTDYVQQNSNSLHSDDDQITIERTAHSSSSEPVLILLYDCQPIHFIYYSIVNQCAISAKRKIPQRDVSQVQVYLVIS